MAQAKHYTNANGILLLKKHFCFKEIYKFPFYLQIQFTILVIHFGHGFILKGSECGYPQILSFMGVTQNLFMIILFADFYRKAYGEKTMKKLH